MKAKVLIVILTAVYSLTFAQSGDEYFEKKDYRNAALKYEMEVITNPNAYLNLGKCYFEMQEFDLALEAMQSYKKNGTSIDEDYVNNFIKLLKRDDDYVEVTNMGPGVNSDKSEYIPVITLDDKTIYYISNDRVGGLGGEDIWYSTKQDNGTWGNPEAFNALNTDSHEGLLSISEDGNVAIVFGNYKGTFGGGDLFYSVKTDEGWTLPCNLGGAINTDGWESQAQLAPDGKTLLFCAEWDNGYGNSDIYMSELTKNGWSVPVNLGNTINSGYGDMGPYMAPDMKTLYFHSWGHEGFGGADIFMSKRKDDSWTNWTKPVNLGKYINTIDDDKYLTVPASGIKGYLVRSDQPDGYGGSDIYEFVLPPSMRPEPVFNIYGQVTDENDSVVGAIIRFIDMDKNTEAAQAVSNTLDGMYKVSIPPLHKYQIVIDMKGFLYYTDILDLTNDSLWQTDETFNDKIASEVNNINKYKRYFDEYSIQLQTLLDTNSTDISGTFRVYESLAEDFRINSKNLDKAIKRAKLIWLSEENEQMEMRKDFELTRIKIGAKFELKNIFFDFGKASLTDASKIELNKLYDIMNRSDIVIELGGHTDNVGSDESNKKLSQDRVNSVKKYLVDKGIDFDRIAAVGYGEERPIASNETDEGRQKNRRVELQITDIRPREGADELSDANKKKEEETTKFDFLTTLQDAAKTGGLPKGSPCSDEIAYLHDDVDDINLYDEKDALVDEIDLDNYCYKTFNAHLLNFGYKDGGGSLLGAGVTFVRENDLREFHAEYYFKGSDSVKWQFGTGYLWTWQLTDLVYQPILLHAGLDFNLYGADSVFHGKEGIMGFFTIPLGIRYNYVYDDDIIITPEFMYNLGYKVFETPDGQDDIKTTYIRIGVNGRYKNFQGGLFYNSGKLVNYLGFRLGIAF
ncbi:MAG: OmpA family protein [Chlorobi bacterium]|nr:OmpA family protein [Chlorobiota bacterium]